MPPAPAATFPGPAMLGRGVVVAAGAPTPAGFETAPRIVVDDAVLAHPAAAASVLHHHWLHRQRIIIEMAVSNAAVREPEVVELPPYAVPPDLDLHRDRLHTFAWANTYDLRSGQAIWWHGELAQRHTPAGPPLDGGDITLPDGRSAWVDGGPRGPLARSMNGADDLPLIHRESIALGRLTEPGHGDPTGTDQLAADQMRAVRHPAGPARIIAPAGSGKTRVLTARLRHLLRDRNVEPELLTAVAYNTRAAAELRTRTQDLRGSIRTLHSLALWICNLDVRSAVIQERDVRGILDGLVRTSRVPNQDPLQAYLEALSDVRMALRDPAEVEESRGDVDGFAAMFEDFRAELRRRGALDFDEQVYRALELLLSRPDIRARAQRLGTHLLVDEFQDLTPAFLLLIRLVAGPMQQVFAVGDDDQTIYSYAGATPRYLVDIDRWFPGAVQHALEVNYRCPTDVVSAAVQLLSHNRVRVQKDIRSGHADDAPASSTASGDHGAADAVDGVAAATRSDVRAAAGHGALAVHSVPAGEMSRVAVQVIADHIGAAGSPEDIAVLSRVNSALLPIQVALSDAGITHTGPLDVAVLGRTGIRTALAYLRLGLDLERIRRDDLLDTINRPARKVKSAVQPLLRSGRTSIRQLEQIGESLDSTHRDRFLDYLADLRCLEEAITDGADTRACLRIIRERIGLGEAMDALDASRSRPEGSSHADDLDALLQLAAIQEDPAAFRDWLADRLRVPGDATGVTLSSIHRVKGMEWDQVLVFAANAGLFPHRLSDDIEEERRVFHVALTRCRERVVVIADRDRPSPFVAELTAPARRTSSVDRAAALTAATKTPASVPARREGDGSVIARLGAEFGLPGGFTGRAVVLDADGIEVRIKVAGGDTRQGTRSVRLRLAYGDTVIVDGQATRLARTAARSGDGARGRAGPNTQRSGSGDDPSAEDDLPVDEELFEALRRWRARVAAESGVPAYLVFHDRHLRLIAGRRPATLKELGGCPGVGPTKLDRYGDDILDLLDRHQQDGIRT